MARREECLIKSGLWGGFDGTPWLFEYIPLITKIKIHAGYVIDSIAFEYMDGPKALKSPTYGGPGGKLKEIDLGPNNQLKAISGYYGKYYGFLVIKSLKFDTTNGTYGPYGTEEGTAFDVNGENFVGFFGYFSQWLNALGFYLKPTA